MNIGSADHRFPLTKTSSASLANKDAMGKGRISRSLRKAEKPFTKNASYFCEARPVGQSK